jgi:class 3 adenylate cyclase
MEPEVRYARTEDGVNVAYYSMGEGTPVVLMNLPNTHIQMEWQMDDVRRAYENVARVGTLVRYDHRGFGLSDRDVSDFSIEALLRDLRAVVDKLGLRTFQLVAYGLSSPLAIAFAAEQASRVARLVLWPGFARLPETLTEPIGKLLALDDSQWEFVTESIMRLGQGWSDQTSGQAAAQFRESATRDTVLKMWRQAADWDATNLLTRVVAPTLLVQETREKQFPPDIARKLATMIPDARVVILDGESRPERLIQAASAVFPFLLGQQPVAREVAAQPSTGGTAIILFTDIVDSTALTERLGDAAFRDKARDLDGTLRTIIRDNGGTPIEGKLLGDGVLATFASASQAIAAALACGKAGEDGGLPLHLGLHAGDVIREENNVFGGAVNVAARISGLSAASEVLVSDIVRGLARTSAGVSFEDRGERELKGVGEAVRVWAVQANRQTGKPANRDGEV